MARKPPLTELERLNSVFWTEAVRSERLRDRISLLIERIEEVENPQGREQALVVLRQIYSEVWNIESTYQDLAWKVDEVVDALD